MKKIISTLLSLTLASSLAFGLVACGGDGNKDDGKVTAEQWAAALNKSNFASFQVKQVSTRSGKYTLEDETTKVDYVQTETTMYTIAGDKQYSKAEMTASGDKAFVDEFNKMAAKYGTTEEQYGLKVDDEIFIRYRKKEDTWKFDVIDFALFDFEMINTFATMYDSFEYNSEQKGYTIKEDDPMAKEIAGTVLKFKNSKLVGAFNDNSYTDEETGETTKYTTSFTLTYGSYSVNLPATTSDFAGTWETYQFEAMGATLGVGNTIPEGAFGEGSPAMEIKADSVTVTMNNDGTASYKFWDGTGKGAYEYNNDYISFYSNDLEEDYDTNRLSMDYEDEHLTFEINYKGVDVTVTLVKKAA